MIYSLLFFGSVNLLQKIIQFKVFLMRDHIWGLGFGVWGLGLGCSGVRGVRVLGC